MQWCGRVKLLVNGKNSVSIRPGHISESVRSYEWRPVGAKLDGMPSRKLLEPRLTAIVWTTLALLSALVSALERNPLLSRWLLVAATAAVAAALWLRYFTVRARVSNDHD